MRKEREEAVRRRREAEQRQGAGRSSALAAASAKKLTKGQKKKLKAKAKKQAEKTKQSGATLQEEHTHDDEAEDEVEADETAVEECHASNQPTLASFTPAPSAASTSHFALPSSSSVSASLPTSSSTASTVTSNSFSNDSFASASSESFTSSSFDSPARFNPPPRPQSSKADLPSFPAPPPPVASASHLDSMLAAFESLSINSPASLIPALSPPLSSSTSTSATTSSSPAAFPPHLPFLTKICDLGNGCWLDKHFTDDVTTRQYRAPEVLVGYPYTTAIDVWSTACLVFELVTGDYLFDPKEASGPSNHTGGANSSQYDRDEDHLALMMELLGPMPRRITTLGKYSEDFFTKRGELKHIKELDKWGLRDVLVDKYKLSRVEADGLSGFLLPMLQLEPEKRITAEQALRNPWLWDNTNKGQDGSGSQAKGGDGMDSGKKETETVQAQQAAAVDDRGLRDDDDEDAEAVEAEVEDADEDKSEAERSDDEDDDGDYEYRDEEEDDGLSGDDDGDEDDDEYSEAKERQTEEKESSRRQ